MRSSKRIVVFLAIASLAAAAVGVFLRAQSRNDLRPQSQAPAQPNLKQVDDDATPIVDLAGVGTIDTNRRLKNSRHDGRRWIKASLGPTVSEVLTEPRHIVSDLPADESDLIIEGEVIASAAFLSNDKNNIYSEFTIRVAKVFKGHELSVYSGDIVTAERLGGRVRYPDGRIVRYRVVGEGSPANGKSYLFFLSRGNSGVSTILTAYEVSAGKVSALDGARTNRGIGKWPFDKHIDQDYASFMSEVAASINRPRITTQPKNLGP